MRLRQPPEIRFLERPQGIATILATSAAALVGSVIWARQGAHRRDRLAALGAATMSAGVAYAITYPWLLRSGRISGGYFRLPTAVRASIDWPLTIGFYTALLAGYRALAKRTRHPLALYGLLATGAVPLTLASAPWWENRGWVRLHKQNTLTLGAIANEVGTWAPVLLYEGLRQTPWVRAAEPRPVATR